MWSARSRRRGRTTLTPATSGAESQSGTSRPTSLGGDANTAVTVTRVHKVDGQAGSRLPGISSRSVAHGALRPQPRRVQSLSRPRHQGVMPIRRIVSR